MRKVHFKFFNLLVSFKSTVNFREPHFSGKAATSSFWSFLKDTIALLNTLYIFCSSVMFVCILFVNLMFSLKQTLGKNPGSCVIFVHYHTLVNPSQHNTNSIYYSCLIRVSSCDFIILRFCNWWFVI